MQSPATTAALILTTLATLAIVVGCTPDRDLNGKGGGANNGVFNNGGANNDILDQYGTGDPVTNVPASLTVDQFAGTYVNVLCGKLYQCEDEAAEERSQLEHFLGFSDEPSCKQNLAALLTPAVEGQLKDAINKGRARWDGSAAGHCLQNFNVVACGIFSDGDGLGAGLEDCERILIPLQDVGDDCGSDGECKGEDVFCNGGDYDLNTQKLTLGVCAELGRDGDSCEWDDNCANGFYCEWTGDEQQVCRATPQPGEACTGDCTDGYTCTWNGETGEQTCQVEPHEGEPCNGTCADELYCDYGLEQPICKVVPGEGDPCTNQCEWDFACSAGTCQDASLFEECGSGGTCPDGLECGNNYLCVEPND